MLSVITMVGLAQLRRTISRSENRKRIIKALYCSTRTRGASVGLKDIGNCHRNMCIKTQQGSGPSAPSLYQYLSYELVLLYTPIADEPAPREQAETPPLGPTWTSAVPKRAILVVCVVFVTFPYTSLYSSRQPHVPNLPY